MILRWTSFPRYASKWAFPAKETGRPDLGVSRRGIIAALVAAALVAGPQPAKAGYPNRLRGGSGGGGGGSVAAVGPHASWTGTGGSGGGVPAQVATVTAKVQICWIWGATNDRFSSDYLVGVFCDALGGISNVTFSGDVATTVVTTPTVQTIAHPNGLGGSITILGYWIRLTRAQFTAISDTNSTKVKLYAKGSPVDATLQPRVIGGDGFGDGSATFANWAVGVTGQRGPDYMPMELYPRTTQYDYDVTAGAGKDFATLQLALANWAGLANKHSGRITCYGTTTQTLTTLQSVQYSGNNSYLVICSANPATDITTIRYGASFDPYGLTGDPWHAWLGADQIKFQGAGIVLDTNNFIYLHGNSEFKPHWFYGCKLIVSGAANRDELAVMWNGGSHPAFGLGNGILSYFDGCEATKVNCGEFGHRFLWNTSDHVLGGRMLNTRIDAYNSLNDTGADPLTNDSAIYPTGMKLPGMTISYSGPATTATVTIIGLSTPESGDLCSFDMTENGSSVKKIWWANGGGGYQNKQDANPSASPNPLIGQQISALVAAVNTWSATAGSHWTAVQDNTDAGMWSSYLNHGKAETFNIKGGGGTGSYSILTGADVHSERQQMVDAQTAAQNDNYLCYANRMTQFSYTSSFWRATSIGTFIFKNCIVTRSVASGSYAILQGAMVVEENNYFDDGTDDSTPVNPPGAYSVKRQSVYSGALTKRSGSWYDYPKRINNMHVKGVDGDPAGAYDAASNIDLGSMAAWKALVRDWNGGDFRPNLSGALASNLVAKINDYDIENMPRASSDCFGPYRLAA